MTSFITSAQGDLSRGDQDGADVDPMERIVSEEERVLTRVQRSLAARRSQSKRPDIDYDAELISLRDQINEARVEDVPPLIEEMERLQAVASRRKKRSEGYVDPGSPYFGRLVLEENQRRREVLIGRSTYIDNTTGTRIVDWRDAPVSRIYYRFEEGDDFEEHFGGREVDGDVLVRRSLSISDGELRRVGAPQGSFVKRQDGAWQVIDRSALELKGGQGAALRPEDHRRPGTLGTGVDGGGRDDKHLPEIAALIDPRQFELITAPSSGLVVIQGGAGSGKTTIGLHRMAYLAFQEPKRFRPDRMLVMVFNDALARYISRVLPALGVSGVLVTTFERWAHRLRVRHFPKLPRHYEEGTPSAVTRFKKSPVLLDCMERFVADLGASLDAEMERGMGEPLRRQVAKVWRGGAPAARIRRLTRWLDVNGPGMPVEQRHTVERFVGAARRRLGNLVELWAELLTDRERLRDMFLGQSNAGLTKAELEQALVWCEQRCALIVGQLESRGEDPRPDPEDDEQEAQEERAGLDPEDDTLLLRMYQFLVGNLGRRNEPLQYEHVFVDEAQDLSPVEMSVVFHTVTKERSVTLAGDVAQRLHMDNGFSDWRTVLQDLGLEHVAVEPLKLSYRSTKPIIDFAQHVLGPLAPRDQPQATRPGVPVELFCHGHGGDAVAFLGEALRSLVQGEPRASVAVITRYPEQAELYFDGLRNAEVANVRLISEQNFPFQAGVDVTDVRQVKGLEFDYVVLVEVSAASYPDNDEARHLLHIAATRAAHQLWVTTTGKASPLVPEWLQERAM